MFQTSHSLSPDMIPSTSMRLVSDRVAIYQTFTQFVQHCTFINITNNTSTTA